MTNCTPGLLKYLGQIRVDVRPMDSDLYFPPLCGGFEGGLGGLCGGGGLGGGGGFGGLGGGFGGGGLGGGFGGGGGFG